jgi:NTP pyrophosphatase (non-canonical NTP hydrolase)
MTFQLDTAALLVAGQTLQDQCHGAAAQWWVDLKTGEDTRSNPLLFTQKLALIHSEVSEALEGDRKDLMDDKLPHRKMREVELADAVIRIFDTAGGFGMDLAGAIVEKLVFNAQREDHKVEHRAAEGGKAY